MDNDHQSSVILEDNFALYPKEHPLFRVTLTRHDITIVPKDGVTNGKYPARLFLRDIVGCNCLRGKVRTDSVAYLCIYAYPKKKAFMGSRFTRKRSPWTLAIRNHTVWEENHRTTELWRSAICCLLKGIPVARSPALGSLWPPKPKKMLVLVNPHSGPGKALQIFQERIIPVFAEAELYFNMVVTEYAGHATAIVKSLQLEDWYGIVIVSGDGLVFETINGLMSRRDWERAIKTPIGVLPGGSGNALSCAINYAAGEPVQDNFPLHAAFVLAKHELTPMDIVAIDTSSQKRLYSMLSVTWGIMADVDIESERYRYMGHARFTVGAIVRMVKLRRYRGRISFLPVGQYHPHLSHSRSSSDLQPTLNGGGKNHKQSNNHIRESGMEGTYRRRGQSIPTLPHSVSCPSGGFYRNGRSSTGSISSQEFSDMCGDGASSPVTPTGNLNGLHLLEPQNIIMNGDNGVHNGHNGMNESLDGASSEDSGNGLVFVPTPLLNPLDKPVPPDWITIEDDFVLGSVLYQTHLNPDMLGAPDKKFGDGVLTLVMIRAPITRVALFDLFGSMAEGKHADSPDVEVVPIKAFRIEPLNDTTYGHICVDGELVDYGPIQGQVMPGLGRVMAKQKDN